MRFLCLHGMGTNGKIFEIQTAAIRHSLGDRHTYEWLDGPVTTQMAPGIGDMVSEHDEFLMWADDTEQSQALALTELLEFTENEGPFDVLMAFSQGAGCGATLLIHLIQLQQCRGSEAVRLPFRCAVFFCGAPPLQQPGCELKEEIIDIPTAHIWGRNDTLYHYGPELSRFCKAASRETLVLDGGHEIPGPRDMTAVATCVQVIRRTLMRAGLE
ncbi:hypothetical protein BDW71DRAFT_217901 [Aspergillus fruticulosus]